MIANQATVLAAEGVINVLIGGIVGVAFVIATDTVARLSVRPEGGSTIAAHGRRRRDDGTDFLVQSSLSRM